MANIDPTKARKLKRHLEAWRGASAKGKRCVSELMTKGHSESSAIAICRASMGEGLDLEKLRKVKRYFERVKP